MNGESTPTFGARLAIMQPYFFPYLGYFQLAASVDTFVFYDDVNFRKGGFVNRNRLLVSGRVGYFTVPLSKASSSSTIDQVQIDGSKPWRRRLATTLRSSYARAPHFRAVFELFERVSSLEDGRISELAKRSVRLVAEYVGLATTFVDSSSVYGNAERSGVERVLDVCRRENAAAYHNLPGGAKLYGDDEFERAGLCLRFVAPRVAPYPQFSAPFVPNLSMLDVLMFNDAASVREKLSQYSLLDGRDVGGVMRSHG
jgi:hypothetical protein